MSSDNEPTESGRRPGKPRFARHVSVDPQGTPIDMSGLATDGLAAFPGGAETVLGKFLRALVLGPGPAGRLASYLPFAVNTILDLTPLGIDAVKGCPVKKVAWISFGASAAARAGAIKAARSQIRYAFVSFLKIAWVQ